MKIELQKCLTLLFRQKGKEILTEKEFVYAVSYDLRWFNPRDAQKLLEISLKTGALKLSQGSLAPTFQLLDQGLQMDYRPNPDILKIEVPRPTEEEGREDFFSDIVTKISSEVKVSKREIVAKINKKKESLGIDIDVAALLVAKSFGVDVQEYVARIKESVLSKQL